MFFAILLGLTWLLLVLRYPARALPVSLAALAALLLLAALMAWQQQREDARLAQVEIRIRHDLQQCPAERPLHLSLHNGNRQVLRELRWRLQVHAPGQSAELQLGREAAQHYDGPGNLLGDGRWHSCLPLPALRPGLRPAQLEYRATDLRGHFGD